MPLPFKPRLPTPPSLSRLLRQANPVRDVIEDARQVVKSTRENISQVASSLHVEGVPEEVPPPEEEIPPEEIPSALTEKAIEEGTACITCSDEHLSEVSGALNEAVRFARDKSVEDSEVLRRLRHAREELNAMERFDLSPQEIARLPEIEKPIARWAVKASRELRHSLNMITSTDDLEKVAGQASDAADQFEKKTMELKKHYEGEISSNIEDLRVWLEERKKR